MKNTNIIIELNNMKNRIVEIINTINTQTTDIDPIDVFVTKVKENVLLVGGGAADVSFAGVFCAAASNSSAFLRRKFGARFLEFSNKLYELQTELNVTIVGVRWDGENNTNFFTLKNGDRVIEKQIN